jgi:beta-N-acetylhexosaminidase
MPVRAFISGVAGLNLSADERAFLRAAEPWGFILFKRNISSPEQVADLVQSFRDLLGWHAPVLIDQEGGRVQRLGPPEWPEYPSGAKYSELYDRDPAVGLSAARLGARLIASDLYALGIDVDCLPLADVPVPGSDAVIGDRAYGTDPAKVTAIARAVSEGLLKGGVLPVLKHLPGHGRATADSHLKLPVVDTDRATLERTDFAAFRPLAKLPLGMTAHVVFSAIDPVAPATTSVTMLGQVIRGSIGFEGLLMSDDISMGALSGSLAERSRAAVHAGCDVVLHCNGKLAEMEEVAAAVPVLAGEATRCAAGVRRGGRASNVRAPGWECGRMSVDFDIGLEADRASTEPAMIVDVEGFEGPLDLLLMLARQQKVDLAKISILALADQYLQFVEEARKLRLELAADYLVMAAWLAYLKSRLLLPEPIDTEGGPSAEDMALALANRLRRLEAIREAATKLMDRPQLGRDVFARGAPEEIAEIKKPEFTATLYDLLTAYAQQRQRTVLSRVRFKQRNVWSLAEARAALERLIGQSADWSRIDNFLISYVVEPSQASTVFASSFASALELVREGVAEIHQKSSFSPLYMRRRVTPDDVSREA